MLKLALKRLTSSDLTYFQWHLDNNPAGKQKAINLSRNVFIDVLYPSLQNMVNYSESNVRIPIDLYIFGPALAGPYHLKRKIIKADSYKNWRLDGETIRSPEGEPERFMVLKPGDIAVMAFEGDLYPRVLHIDFLAADLDVDRDLLKAIDPIIGRQRGSMMGFNQQLLATLINDINPVDDHPIRFLLVDTDDFDVFLGNSLSQRQAGRHVRRRISQDEFDAARQRDEIIGRNGEKLVQTHFELSLKDHAIFCYKWVSCEDVTAPYDFELTNNNGETILLDVKSTGGSFAAPIHISIAQLLTMAQNDKRYDLYRVYELNEKRGKFRIAKNMHDYACSILEVFQTLPEGIQVETIILSPGMINFDGEQIVVLSEDGD